MTRSPFVTGIIQGSDALTAVETTLKSEGCLVGNNRGAGFFAGRIDCTSGSPLAKFERIFNKIDAALRKIGYQLRFDMVVVPENNSEVLCRDTLKEWGFIKECQPSSYKFTFSKQVLPDMVLSDDSGALDEID